MITVRAFALVAGLVLLTMSAIGQTVQRDGMADTIQSPLRFDSSGYVQKRLQAIETYFEENPSTIYYPYGDAVKLLFFSEEPQDFWNYVLSAYDVSEVFFSLEGSNTAGEIDLGFAEVVFRSGSDYYWLHFSHRMCRDSLDKMRYWPPCEIERMVRVETLTIGDIQAFLTSIESNYHLSSMQSHFVDTFLTSGALYAFVQLYEAENMDPVVIMNTGQYPEFLTFYELSYFYDRLKLSSHYDPGRSGDVIYLKRWVSEVQRRHGYGRRVVDSIFQFWPPEVRPDLDSLFAPDSSGREE